MEMELQVSQGWELLEKTVGFVVHRFGAGAGGA